MEEKLSGKEDTAEKIALLGSSTPRIDLLLNMIAYNSV